MSILYGNPTKSHPLEEYDLLYAADGCIEWTRSCNPSGYGHLRAGGKLYQAHRLTWQRVIGDIPDGMCVLHTCDNPKCVNPEHLWLGTRADNNADCISKGRGNRIGSTPGPRPAIRGEKNPTARLTERDVRVIRRLVYSGITGTRVASLFGTGKSQISAIVRRKAWAHV
jgi:HNH endonuclease